MMNLVAVSSRRNAKMLRDWRKLQTRNSPRRKLSRFIMISILWIAYCLYSNNVNTFVTEYGLIDKTNQAVYNIIGVDK